MAPVPSASAEAALRRTADAVVDDADAIAHDIAVMLHREVPETSVDPLLRICHLGHGAFADAWDERIARAQRSRSHGAQPQGRRSRRAEPDRGV